jgi:hypothetical protein
MMDRFERDKSESDTAAFYTLLHAGEFTTKLTVLGLLSGLTTDRERHRERCLGHLVRADSIGDWIQELDLILTGPASQHFSPAFRNLQKELTQRHSVDCWQQLCLAELRTACLAVDLDPDNSRASASGRDWFALFAVLRNRTRGHGATTAGQCSAALPAIEKSIRALLDGFSLLSGNWAYLHRNLSGKYRVTMLGGDAAAFDALKRDRTIALPNGVYFAFDDFYPVALLFTDVDSTDFLVPNGAWKNSQFETLSYITNARRRERGDDFALQPEGLPPSVTRGRSELEPLGHVLTNLPPPVPYYVTRPTLEKRLSDALLHHRHEIVTLAGPGGVGKTSLALQVLDEIARAPESKGRFENIVWFSARDIDLLDSGPKLVRPEGVRLEDFGREFNRLVAGKTALAKTAEAVKTLAESLSSTTLGPSLFVLDNFETVVAPGDLYRWLDTYVRSPNKILITTRTRDFTGDLPIEVGGMTELEASRLIQETAERLGIGDLMTRDYIAELYNESGGHPYVMKILLGEVASTRQLRRPERIIADKETILLALFERTYAALTPAASRCFLLLSSWRSMVPRLAVEAVALRSAEERIDVAGALEELKRLSLIEEIPVPDSAESFVAVPLAAQAFGRRKLQTSSLKASVEADAEVLFAFGATDRSAIGKGVRPRAQVLVKSVARKLAAHEAVLSDFWDLLGFVARRVPVVWLDIAELCEEQPEAEARTRAAQCLRSYLESGDRSERLIAVWMQLAHLLDSSGDFLGALHALVEAAACPDATPDELSECVFLINRLLAAHKETGFESLAAEQRRSLLLRVATVCRTHQQQFDGTDLSRLAWLYVHLGDMGTAGELVSLGMRLEPNNEHLQRLLARRIGR